MTRNVTVMQRILAQIRVGMREKSEADSSPLVQDLPAPLSLALNSRNPMINIKVQGRG